MDDLKEFEVVTNESEDMMLGGSGICNQPVNVNMEWSRLWRREDTHHEKQGAQQPGVTTVSRLAIGRDAPLGAI